jgi:formylglycine-generating enzyme required for sulfatase activity
MGNNLMMDMIWIPAGKFSMGSPDTEPGRGKDEGPVRKVELDGFWLARYEVTQAQYRAIMGNNPSVFQAAQDPVVQVTWANAIDFCNRLGSQTKGKFGLPSEAQWEYACRAGSTQAFAFGDSDRDMDKYGWVQDNSQLQPHPVGKKKPNSFGVYDMHGNVWEWCADWYAVYSPKELVVKNPVGPASGTERVCRGGSCMTPSASARAAFRFRRAESDANAAVGFRVMATELP